MAETGLVEAERFPTCSPKTAKMDSQECRCLGKGAWLWPHGSGFGVLDCSSWIQRLAHLLPTGSSHPVWEQDTHSSLDNLRVGLSGTCRVSTLLSPHEPWCSLPLGPARGPLTPALLEAARMATLSRPLVSGTSAQLFRVSCSPVKNPHATQSWLSVHQGCGAHVAGIGLLRLAARALPVSPLLPEPLLSSSSGTQLFQEASSNRSPQRLLQTPGFGSGPDGLRRDSTKLHITKGCCCSATTR